MSSMIETRASVTVSDLARDSGVSASAVRFYEDNGLITAERTPGNQRRFSPGDACRIKVIRVAQRVGLSKRFSNFCPKPVNRLPNNGTLYKEPSYRKLTNACAS
jgi:hypothetical protein